MPGSLNSGDVVTIAFNNNHYQPVINAKVVQADQSGLLVSVAGQGEGNVIFYPWMAIQSVERAVRRGP